MTTAERVTVCPDRVAVMYTSQPPVDTPVTPDEVPRQTSPDDGGTTTSTVAFPEQPARPAWLAREAAEIDPPVVMRGPKPPVAASKYMPVVARVRPLQR